MEVKFIVLKKKIILKADKFSKIKNFAELD